jgi:hypothetical protein
MKSSLTIAGIAGLALLTCAVNEVQRDDQWTRQFVVEPDELTTIGRNPYFILEPGYQLELRGATTRLVIRVLAETRSVNGVATRVVEERESKDGSLVEVSRNYFAISRRTNSVFYFGEDVDMYERGIVVGHDGAWLAGTNGARFGLAMPGLPLLGARYYQELAEGIAMDRALVTSLSDRVATRAGAFSNVLRIEETTPLEPGVREYKRYVRGIGLVQDGSLKLVRYGRAPA